MPDIDLPILIVTYNSRRLIGTLLDVLAVQLAPLNAEVVLVDNASHDGTADAVAADIARLRGLIARYGELAAGPPEQDALADLGRVADDLERRLALLRTTPADGTAALAGLDTTIADGAAALAVLEIERQGLVIVTL